MSIASISGNSAISLQQWLQSLPGNSSNTTKTSSSDTTSGNVDLSLTSQFLSKLDSLAQSDPNKFQQLTSQISTAFSSAAQQSSGTQSQFLDQLSDKFKTASQTGSAAGLQPQSHHHHGGGHHGGYGKTAQSTDANTLASLFSSTSSTSLASSSNQDLSSVFQNIFDQVAQA